MTIVEVKPKQPEMSRLEMLRKGIIVNFDGKPPVPDHKPKTPYSFSPKAVNEDFKSFI